MNEENKNQQQEKSIQFKTEITDAMNTGARDVSALVTHKSKLWDKLPSYKTFSAKLIGLLSSWKPVSVVDESFKAAKDARKTSLAKSLKLQPGDLESNVVDIVADSEVKLLFAVTQLSEKIGTVAGAVSEIYLDAVNLGDRSTGNVFQDLLRGNIYLAKGRQRFDVKPILYDLASKSVTRIVARPFSKTDLTPSPFAKDAAGAYFAHLFPSAYEPAIRTDMKLELILKDKALVIDPDEFVAIVDDGLIFMPTEISGRFAAGADIQIKDSKGNLIAYKKNLVALKNVMIFRNVTMRLDSVYDESFFGAIALELGSRAFGAQYLPSKLISTFIVNVYDVVTSKYPLLMNLSFFKKLGSFLPKKTTTTTTTTTP